MKVISLRTNTYIISMFMLVFPANVLAATAGVPNYSQIKEAVQKNYQARLAALDNSSGSAEMAIDVTQDWYLPEKKQEITGTRKATWIAQWYTKGKKQRYDYIIDSNQGGEPDRLQIPTGSIRVIVDPNKRVYYKVDTREVIIDNHISPPTNPQYFTVHFEIKRLYKGPNGSGDVSDLFESYEKTGIKPVITEEKIGEIRCVKITYNSQRPDSAGQIRNHLLELWLSPEQGYSLIKLQFFSDSDSQGKGLRLIESYDAAYRQSQEQKDIWLLKELTIGDYRTGGKEEKLRVVFSDVKVNANIKDETFSLDKLGIPDGTSVYNAVNKELVIGTYSDGAIKFR
jgi:outer membrane lipoprotein-sorting protein